MKNLASIWRYIFVFYLDLIAITVFLYNCSFNCTIFIQKKVIRIEKLIEVLIRIKYFTCMVIQK